MNIPRRWKIFAITGVLTIVFDLWSKSWAEGALGNGEIISVIENFWDWRLSYNTGSAFGMFHSMGSARIFLSVVGLFALGFVVYMQQKAEDKQTWMALALGGIAGGAIGNLYDRILYGKVTDFIVWRYYDAQWPTFNIADAALCVGVGILLLDSFRQAREEKRAAELEKAESKKSAKPGGSRKKKNKR